MRTRYLASRSFSPAATLTALLLLLLGLMPPSVMGQQTSEGRYLGARESEIPEWFKESFLDFEEDVAEARDNGRRVLLYFYQNGCPYCAKLVEENFQDPKIRDYVQSRFDGIALNMWGDREIVSIGGRDYTEKSFAEALKVQYTPTLLFLDEQGRVVLRLNGYYPPAKLRKALRFAGEGKEKETTFANYMLDSEAPRSGSLIGEDFFLDTRDLKSLIRGDGRYLAVYFEAPGCDDCAVMHQRVLSDAPTRALAKQMRSVQLNVYAEEPVTTVDGRRMTARDYARELGIAYTPSVVFFDDTGKEVHRIEGFLKTFHFQSSLAYVLEQGYDTQPSFQRYISARGEMLRAQGYDTDIWGYESAFPAEAQGKAID